MKESLTRVLPTTIVHDGFGASETGGQGRLTGTGEDGAPRFDMDATNVWWLPPGSPTSRR